jgi:hypothetical protein
LRAWDEVTQEGLLRELTIRTGGGGGAPGVRAPVYLLFTCFTSTKLHILTPEELPGGSRGGAGAYNHCRLAAPGATTLVLSLLAFLVQMYKYWEGRGGDPEEVLVRIITAASLPQVHPVYLLYWYKSTNTDTRGAA